MECLQHGLSQIKNKNIPICLRNIPRIMYVEVHIRYNYKKSQTFGYVMADFSKVSFPYPFYESLSVKYFVPCNC